MCKEDNTCFQTETNDQKFALVVIISIELAQFARFILRFIAIRL